MTDVTQSVGFDIENAKKESEEFLAEFIPKLMLKDPEKDEDLFLVSPPSINPDGSLVILCASSENSDNYIMHTIFSGYIDKSNIEFKKRDDIQSSNIIMPSNSGIVGINGELLS